MPTKKKSSKKKKTDFLKKKLKLDVQIDKLVERYGEAKPLDGELKVYAGYCSGPMACYTVTAPLGGCYTVC